jgi:hypothetical protein
MYNNSSILPWILFVKVTQKAYPGGGMDIFFVGFLTSALVIAAIGTGYTIFSRKEVLPPRNFAWMGVSLGVFLTALGLWIALLPAEGAPAAASVLQTLGLIGFETAVFWTVYLSSPGNTIQKKIFLPSLGAPSGGSSAIHKLRAVRTAPRDTPSQAKFRGIPSRFRKKTV